MQTEEAWIGGLTKKGKREAQREDYGRYRKAKHPAAEEPSSRHAGHGCRAVLAPPSCSMRERLPAWRPSGPNQQEGRSSANHIFIRTSSPREEVAVAASLEMRCGAVSRAE